MRKARFDLDATQLIRQWPEAQPGTLACYLALREIAALCETTDFYATLAEIGKRSLLSETGTRRALDLMQRRSLINKRRTGRGLAIKLYRVAKV
jgi:CTP-dependent riboflavin kinase|tara:strand:- start:1030 stop:1311 length:282 start_codon:yes stop_codon:yes gene_type:complete